MDPNENLIKSLILTGFSLIGLTIIVNQLMKKQLKPFKKVGIVSKLFIYPIKSLKPIELDSFDYNDQEIYWKSLQDRTFMLVNRKNVVITQRQEPSLVKLIVKLDYPYLIVTTPDESDSVQISIEQQQLDNEGSTINQEVIKTTIWGDDVYGVDCGPEISSFFSNYLNKPETKLLRFTDNLNYRPSQIYRDGHLEKDDNIKIKYQDTATCHLINVNSVDTLNGWIDNVNEKVTFMNFRPNILVSADPFEEESWERIKFDSQQSTEWRQLLKCVRCRVTTVNIEKAIFMKEPLPTLKSPHHRPLSKEDQAYAITTDTHGKKIAPLMGVFFKPESTGTIKVGQTIWASHKRGLFWFL